MNRVVSNIVCDAAHRYTLNGRLVPGVTEVIRHFIPSSGTGTWYLDRGKAVHLAVHLALEQRLDWSTVSPEIVGRVNSIIAFIKDAKLVPLNTETSLASKLYQFAGTLDFVGPVAGDNDLILCDWKGTVDDAATLQLGAYSILWSAASQQRIARAAAVQCFDDGHYKAHWIKRRQLDEAGRIFLAMRTIYGWKLTNNLIKTDKHES